MLKQVDPDPKLVAFGREVVRRRTLLGLKQRALARAAGMSDAGIRNIEKGLGAQGPTRINIIKLANALNWNPNEALIFLGQPPATLDEHTVAERVADPREELDKLWPSLTRPQQWALVVLARTMTAPRQWPDLGELAQTAEDAEPATGDLPGLQLTRGAGEIPTRRNEAEN